MNKIREAIDNIHHMDMEAGQDKWLNGIHPLPKLIVTLLYIALVVSFDKYDFTGLLGMILYLIVLMTVGELSIRHSLKQLRVLLLFVCMVGSANPFLDQTILGNIGPVSITGGVVSMLTLMLKGIFSVLAAFILISTTSMESICYAMRLLHIPKIMVTLVMLIYRYIILMLKEAERISQAYSMRAPGQKGIHYKAWGTLVGQLLLRSIDRAQEVYESMILRGYDGEFYTSSKSRFDLQSILYLFGWVMVMLMLRITPIFHMAGHLFS